MALGILVNTGLGNCLQHQSIAWTNADWQLDSNEQYSLKYEAKFNDFHLWKWLANVVCKILAILYGPLCIKKMK